MRRLITLERSVKNRSRGIGGSDVGSIFGLNKWMSLPRLWLQKLNRLPKQSGAENEMLEWGNLLEAPIASRYAKVSGRRIQLVNRTIVHPEYPWMLANPDRLQWDSGRPRAERRGILEIKATMFGNLRAWQSGGVPASYYLQLQHYLCVLGLSWGSFAVLFGGNRLVQFDVARDEALIKVMIEREREFWELVQSETPPSITLSKEWNEQLAAFFPTASKDKQVVLDTPEAVGHMRRLLSLNRQIKKRELEVAEHETWLKAQIGEAQAERLLVPKVGRASWSLGERRSIDLEKLRSQYPSIAVELTKVDPQRRFSMKSFEDIKEETTDERESAPAIFGARRIELD